MAAFIVFDKSCLLLIKAQVLNRNVYEPRLYFTLQYFADAKPQNFKNFRIRKGELHLLSSPVRLIQTMNKNEVDDLAWDEKNLSDFDLSDEGLVCEEEQEDYEVPKIKSGTQKSKDTIEDIGHIFPLDFWIILGDYIDAEDVSRFAMICQSAHMVTHTVRFWQGLYERLHTGSLIRDKMLFNTTRKCCKYNKTVKLENIPWDLHPKHMDRIHGLRTRVIRAMFYMNPVFLNRLRSQKLFEQDPDTLRGFTCNIMWHKKEKIGKWLFNFKFLKKSKSQCPYVKTKNIASKKFRLSADDDIHINSEDGIHILQVLCPNFMSLPSTMGLVLTSASISVSNQGMRYHKLRLHFDQTLSSMSSGSGGSTETVVVIDPVINVSILPWWHPKYPYSTG